MTKEVSGDKTAVHLQREIFNFTVSTIKMTENKLNNPEEAAQVRAVSIKAPEFSPACSSTYFRILEAQFNLNNITVSRTKFFHAIASLPTTVVDNISTTILDSSDYDEIKKAVIAFYEKTKPELFAKLISSTIMTGRPSANLRELGQIASKVGAGDDLVRHQFIQTLPSTISPVIASQKSLNLAQLGVMADELMPLHTQINNLNLSDKSEKNYYVENKSSRRFAQPSANNNNTEIPYGVQPFRENQRPKICRFHIYYGNNANRCKPCCHYPDKAKCSMQPASRPGSPNRNFEPSSRSSSPSRPARQGN